MTFAKSRRSGTPWSESEYAAAGTLTVKLRLKRTDAELFRRIAKPTESPQDTLRRLIAEESERHAHPRNRPSK